MQQTTRRELAAQSTNQVARPGTLLDRVGGKVPFGPVRIVDRNKCRLATHGKPDVVFLEVHVDGFAQSVDRLPLLLTVGSSNARGLKNTGDAHFMMEASFAFVDGTGDGRRR